MTPLTTARNRIVRAGTSAPVLLRGVNRSGLEYKRISDVTVEEMRVIVEDWGANILRVPFNQTWALDDKQYLAALDQAIAWAAELGAYTILDLQWLDDQTVFGTTPEPNHVAPTPNALTIALWRKLAEHYRDNPALLFDLFNEPHDRLKDDPYPIQVVRPDGAVVESKQRHVDAAVWVPWADRLIAEIREAGFDGIVLVGGTQWAFDLSEIELDWNNVVYSTHIYSNRDRADWDLALGQADDVPVFVGEWGGTDSPEDLQFGRDLADRMRGTVAGWTAWSWVDRPYLIQPPPAPKYTPTAFGELVRAELRRDT